MTVQVNFCQPCCCWLCSAIVIDTWWVIWTPLPLQVQYGYINLEEIFRDSTRLSVVDLSSLLMAKIAATSVCVGGGLVGGLFAPSLFIGALVGDIMGHFVANRLVRTAGCSCSKGLLLKILLYSWARWGC
jgi:H+/Cl- antiporter ClcA